MRKVLSIIAALSFLLVASAFSQDAGFTAAASDLYGQNRFQEAYDLIAKSVPEATAKVDQKNAAGDYLTEMGVSEYRKRNFKNAYECFRKALKYTPTNSTAAQYYLKIKKEQDVANLKNEGTPSATELTLTAGTPVTGGVATPSGVAASTVQSADITALIKQLGEAENQLAALASSDRDSKKDNESLRNQLDQQRTILQQLRAQPASGATKASNAEEQAIIKETLKVMSAVAERLDKQQAPQVIVQPNEGAIPPWVIMALLSFIAVMITALALAIVMTALRARARKNFRGGEGYTLPLDTQLVGSPSSARTLLDYRGEPVAHDRALAIGETGLKRDLLKAEHLNRLSEEVKNGTLSWETVRKYIGEMETDLKSAILKIVEAKIDEGDLVTNEAVLPVLFPFLTDYDAFIREKSERLARTALLPEGRKDEFGVPSGADEELGAFDIKSLVSIPQKLKSVLKGNDQSLVVAKLSRGIAKHLGLSVNDCQDIYKAALAHDAGYLVLDQDRLQQILGKTEIGEDDFEFIQSHTKKAPLYFGEIDIPRNILDAMYYHHERNDGSGYPEGLKKEAIPLFAKIIGLSETFAALIAHRAYRDKVDYAQALAIIRDSRTKFDREIIEALTSVVQSTGSYK